MSADREASARVQASTTEPHSRWQPDHPAPAPVPLRWRAIAIGTNRAQLRSASRLVAALAAAGVPVGLVWLALAPRRAYEVVDGGFQAVEPQSEALIGADAWLTILTGILGVAVAGLVWRFVRVRGVSILIGLAAGMVLASVIAWQVGELVGGGPSEEQAAQIGAILAPPLQLRAAPVLVIGAFLATLCYLILVSFAPRDDLQRGHLDRLSSGSRERPVAGSGRGPLAAPPGPSAPYATDVTVPRAVQPSGLRPAAPGDPQP